MSTVEGMPSGFYRKKAERGEERSMSGPAWYLVPLVNKKLSTWNSYRNWVLKGVFCRIRGMTLDQITGSSPAAPYRSRRVFSF
jgi:hypothetical protein